MICSPSMPAHPGPEPLGSMERFAIFSTSPRHFEPRASSNLPPPSIPIPAAPKSATSSTNSGRTTPTHASFPRLACPTKYSFYANFLPVPCAISSPSTRFKETFTYSSTPWTSATRTPSGSPRSPIPSSTGGLTFFVPRPHPFSPPANFWPSAPPTSASPATS